MVKQVMRSALTGKVGRLGAGKPARLRVWLSYAFGVGNTAGQQLKTYATTDASAFQDWSAFAALFESFRCLQLRIDFAVTHTSEVVHGDVIFVAPDVDSATAPTNAAAVISRANEVEMFPTDACSGHHQRHTYRYKVPRNPPYSNFVDTGAPTQSGGVVHFASEDVHIVGNAIAVQALVRGEFEFVNRE